MEPYPNPPETVSPKDLPEPELTPEGVPIPAFTPWWPKRERAQGWSALVQRAFIAELTRIGSVSAAAQAVGKTARSAYQLRDKAGAESFAAAWECAKALGQEQAQRVAIQRALHGEVIPQFRNGHFLGYKIVQNDRMLISVLSSARAMDTIGARSQLDHYRDRLTKWECALRREAMDMADGAAQTQEEAGEAWEDHKVWEREMKRQARLQRNAEIRAAVKRGMAPPQPPEPRIRSL
jgi:hypothetical protein